MLLNRLILLNINLIISDNFFSFSFHWSKITEREKRIENKSLM